MPVQESEQVHYGGQGRRLAAFITGERIVSASCQLGSHGLAQAEFLADPADLGAFRLTRSHYQFVACHCVAFRTLRIEHDLRT